MVVQDESVGARRSGSAGDTTKTLLAAAGLAAAFGVASCCALPVALSLVGIGAASASLFVIGSLAAPYQHVLFYAAVLLLGAAGVVMWRQRRVRACSPGAARARPALDAASIAAMVLALGLLALTFWIEPPPWP